MILTKALDEALQHYEIAGIRSAVATVARLYSEVQASSIELRGGFVAFTGVDSPFSYAVGVGALAPVNDTDIRTITQFYESRGAAAQVLVTPLSDPSLARGLAAAGYAPHEYQNVLLCDQLAGSSLDDRIAIAADLKQWACASAQAFLDVAALNPGDERVAIVLASSQGVRALEAREDGAIVATGAMDVRGDCSALFAGSTKPEFRNRGWHTALIRDRMARARAAGARFIRASTQPGSASERNFLRCGFAVLYTRTMWQL